MAHLTPNGNISLKPKQGRTWKKLRRINIIANLEARFVGDQEIADMLNITVAAVQNIKRQPEYLAKRIELSTGVLSIYEQARLQDEDAQKDKLDSLIPKALAGIENILNNKDHPHFARVATDLLDRSRITSKISRTEHSVAPPKTSAEQDKQAQELLSLLEPGTMTAPELTPPPAPKIPEIIQELPEPADEDEDLSNLVM